jgi:hypothetical protein
MTECIFECLIEQPDHVIFDDRIRAAIEKVDGLAFDLFYERSIHGSGAELQSETAKNTEAST